MQVKEKSEKAGLKLSMASSPITSWQIEGEKVEAVTDFLCLGSEITADLRSLQTAALKLEDDPFLSGKLWETRTLC